MKIICVGRNYVNHIIELENEHPKNPLIFFKNSECLSNIKLFSMPQFSNNIHHEVELVFRICKSGKNIKVNDTKEYISHIALGIDFTARDIQNEYKAKGYPWSFSKNFASYTLGLIDTMIMCLPSVSDCERNLIHSFTLARCPAASSRPSRYINSHPCDWQFKIVSASMDCSLLK